MLWEHDVVNDRLKRGFNMCLELIITFLPEHELVRPNAPKSPFSIGVDANLDGRHSFQASCRGHLAQRISANYEAAEYKLPYCHPTPF